MKMNHSVVKACTGRAHIDADIGVEIEVESDRLLPHIPKWNMENEASIQNGMEYISNPMTMEKLGPAVRAARDILEPYVKVSDRAGIHLHCNMKDLTVLQFARYLTCWYMMEEIIVSVCGNNRQGNHFCLRLIDAPAVLRGPMDGYRMGELEHMLSDQYRYAALNYQSLFKFGTVEFRAIQTTPSLHPVLGVSKILVDLRERVKTLKKTPDEILMDYSAEESGAEDFIQDILGKHNLKFLKAHSKMDEDWDTSVHKAIRIVQDFAFTTNWKG